VSSGAPVMGAPIHQLAFVLRDPVRLQLLVRLGAQEMSANDAAKAVRLPLSNVAYHMRILKESGLLTPVEKQRVRGAVKTTYRALSGDELRSGHVPFPRTPVGEAEARIFELLICAVEEALQASLGHRRAKVPLRPLLLDEEGLEELVRVIGETDARIAGIANACERRLEGSEETGIQASIEIAFRESAR
jgi:DNA-binding transcriptional ArsR family regulator